MARQQDCFGLLYLFRTLSVLSSISADVLLVFLPSKALDLLLSNAVIQKDPQISQGDKNLSAHLLPYQMISLLALGLLLVVQNILSWTVAVCLDRRLVMTTS